MDSTITPGQKTVAEDPSPEMSPEENPSASPSAEEDFGALLDQSMEEQKVEVGEVVAGKVIGVGSETVTVDIGYKSEGEVPLEEFKRPDGTHAVNVGDTIKVFFEAVEDEEGIVWLSKEKADQLRIWDDLQEAYNKEETVEGRIVQRVKGGLSVDIGVPAFLLALNALADKGEPGERSELEFHPDEGGHQ